MEQKKKRNNDNCSNNNTTTTTTKKRTTTTAAAKPCTEKLKQQQRVATASCNTKDNDYNTRQGDGSINEDNTRDDDNYNCNTKHANNNLSKQPPNMRIGQTQADGIPHATRRKHVKSQTHFEADKHRSRPAPESLAQRPGRWNLYECPQNAASTSKD